MTDDAILLTDYDPNWPRFFEQEAGRVQGVLGDSVIDRIEHFGSTAVPGLTAKPVIDIMVIVHDLAHIKDHIDSVERLGYSYWRANPKPDVLFCVKGLPPHGPRTHHLHIVETGSAFVDRLHFRDYLRLHPEEARRYEALKHDLAAKFPDDREAYTQGKTEYVLSVMAKAQGQHIRTGPHGEADYRHHARAL